MQHRPHTRAQVAPRGGLRTRVLPSLQAHGVIREQGLAVLIVIVRFALRMLQHVDVGLHIQLKERVFCACATSWHWLAASVSVSWCCVVVGSVWVFTSEVPCSAVLEDPCEKKTGAQFRGPTLK